MRVAALYDIHGNLPALDAVLEDVEREGVQEIVVGGDIASGPMPRETLARLMKLERELHVIRGNADRELVAHSGAASSTGDVDVAESDVWLLRDRWAARQLTESQRAFLACLPDTVVLDISGLGATLFCHGTPRSDDEIITRITPERRLRTIFSGINEEVVVCGHTHVQFDRVFDGKRIVNAGSVGMPYERVPGAYWALLGPEVSLRRTEYDLARARERICATTFPHAEELDLAAPPDPDEATDFFESVAERAV